MNNSLVDVVLQNVMEIMPFRIIMSYERGVRWRLGVNPKALDPGFHWCLPLLHTIEVININEEFHDLPVQTVTTSDGREITFSANVGYRIVDPVLYWEAVNQFDESIAAKAMVHLSERVRECEYQWLIKNQKELEKSLRGTLETRLKRWGATVTEVGFTEFVHVTALRIFKEIEKP